MDQKIHYFDRFYQLLYLWKTSKVLKNSVFLYSSSHIFGKVPGIKHLTKMLILGLFHYSPISLTVFSSAKYKFHYQLIFAEAEIM